jgi:uncharacterized RDD family membrane protein YckC
MRCAECGEVLTVGLGACPFCQKLGEANTTDYPEGPAPPTVTQANAPAMTDNSNASTSATQAAAGSTLIEFPGVNRRPAWRKELSERFREIQQRRAREAALEAEQELIRAAERADTRAEPAPAAKSQDEARASAQLGLVPTPDEPEMNPIVAAALRRIERAHSQESAQHVARGGSHRTHGPATAAARVYEERPETLAEDAPPKRAEAQEAEAEQTRATPLVVVPPARNAVAEAKAAEVKAATAATPAPAVEEKAAPAKSEAAAAAVESARVNERVTEEPAKATAAETQQARARQEEQEAASRQPRHISGVLDEFWLERQGIELLPKVAEREITYDDRAPRLTRLAAGVVDLLVVALICAPFAAAIELTISNWGNPRVWGSMAGIAAVVMFLYHTCAVALAGRTAGMSLCSLHAVDAHKASVPTTGQCARRTLVYMLSLATLGLALLYSLFDAEGRAAHDILSGTVVVKN